MQGKCWMPLNKRSFSCYFLISVSINKLYVSEWQFSIAIWNP
jgi:hypothetical protein